MPSVRGMHINDSVCRNGAWWQLRVCLRGWRLPAVVHAFVAGVCQQLCMLTWLTPAGGSVGKLAPAVECVRVSVFLTTL